MFKNIKNSNSTFSSHVQVEMKKLISVLTECSPRLFLSFDQDQQDPKPLHRSDFISIKNPFTILQNTPRLVKWFVSKQPQLRELGGYVNRGCLLNTSV